MKRQIFVFGSNLAGRHGKGAALYARKNFGAIYGRGIGLQGDSYGIPTKDERIKTLPLDQIKLHVDEFLVFAEIHPEMMFNVSPIGCGLAGYTPEDIAPMFKNVPHNVILHDTFKYVLGLLHNRKLDFDED